MTRVLAQADVVVGPAADEPKDQGTRSTAQLRIARQCPCVPAFEAHFDRSMCERACGWQQGTRLKVHSADATNVLQVNLNLESKAKHARKTQHKGYRNAMGTGHAFSASNPYGKKSDGDTRQFVRM